MIEKNLIEKVWLPTSEEISTYLSNFKKPLILPVILQEIILRYYNNTLKTINITSYDTKCPYCKSELKKQVFNNLFVRYVCPNFPKCNGYKITQREYESIEKIKINHFSKNWISNLENELKIKGYNISRNLIYRYLRENNLKSPGVIEKDLIIKHEKKEWNCSTGYIIAKKNSLIQEKYVYEKLKNIYSEYNIKKQQFVFYKYKNQNIIRHKKIDFLIITKNEVIIVECKVNEYNLDEEQKNDYITLIQILYPQKIITFKYEIGKNND